MPIGYRVSPVTTPDPNAPRSPRHAIIDKIRQRYVGVLVVDTERVAAPLSVRYVIGSGSSASALVTITTGSLRDAGEAGATLFAPEEWEGAAQLLVMPREMANPDSRAECDRWQAYHGKPPSGVWFELNIESARLGSAVLDDPLDLTNPLASVEAGLCRQANADRAALARLASRLDGHPISDAVCVGVDATGFDLRCPAGVLRVAFVREATTGDEARAQMVIQMARV